MKPTQKLSVKFVMAFGWGLEGYMTVFMLPHLTICRRTHANHQSSINLYIEVWNLSLHRNLEFRLLVIYCLHS